MSDLAFTHRFGAESSGYLPLLVGAINHSRSHQVSDDARARASGAGMLFRTDRGIVGIISKTECSTLAQPRDCRHRCGPGPQVDITFQRRSCRSEDTLPSSAHHFPGFERAASGAIYRRALARGAVNSRVCRVPLVPNAESTSTTR